jgi:RNA polymerase sigma-70 factor (ECF subfamily)
MNKHRKTSKMTESAFEQMARQLRQRALEASLRCGATETEAEDMAQETMLRLWQMRSELNRYRSIEAVAAQTARRLTLNAKRRAPAVGLDTLKATTAATSAHTPDELLMAREDEAWLEQQLRQLPTTQHTLLYMRQVELRTTANIARLTGLEETSVRTLLARARRTLLEEIKKRR